MELQKQLDKMKSIQISLLNFLDFEDNLDERYLNLINLLENYKIQEDPTELRLFLSLLTQISIDHHRTNFFINKIEKILAYFKDQIKNNYSNEEIFHIFIKSKRVLLFLIEEQIIIMNQKIVDRIMKCYRLHYHNDICINGYYYLYFYPEIEPFLNKPPMIKKPESFDKEKRRKGENDNYICELIRNDSIDEFISYIDKTDYPLKEVKKDQIISIYETNLLLMNFSMNLIEYAAFFGSIQIFKYLYKNGLELNSSIWKYAIHGNNSEIFHILEENDLSPDEESFFESIKCHHIQITNYIIQNYSKSLSISKCLRYFNFMLIDTENLNDSFSLFYDFCKYDYVRFAEILLKTNFIDINQKITKTKKINFSNSHKKRKNTFRNRKEKSALIVAIEKRNIEIVQLLLKNGNLDVNSKRTSYILNRFEIGLKPLPLTVEVKTALQIAIEKNDIEMVKLLLSHNKIDVNMKSKYFIRELEDAYEEASALFIAIKNNNFDIVKLLLSHENIDVNIQNKFVLNFKGHCNKFIWIRWLLELKSEWSNWCDDEELYLCLIENDGLNYQLMENHMKTPIHLAVEKNNFDIVKLLLSINDLDINIKSKQFSLLGPMKEPRFIYIYHFSEDIEKTALFISIEKNSLETVKLLLSIKNIDLNIKCRISQDNEINALQKAIKVGNIEIINILNLIQIRSRK